MRLTIRHTTVYTYEEPFVTLIEALRLTPRPHAGQLIHRWSVRVDDERPLATHIDGYGNIVLTFSARGAHTSHAISVDGEVETTDTYGVVKSAIETITPRFFLSTTPQTEPDAAIFALADAASHRKGGRLQQLHGLMLTVRERIEFIAGETHARTTAAEALAEGRGVCQDHAHVFISAARAMGCPARYVSGYLWAGDDIVAPASHAWAEAYVEQLGWVGFDVANHVCPTDAYVRVAIGRCYAEAIPVRGVRTGGRAERMTVNVQVAAMQQQ
jgi:transglutaminase-like putative cysteine protease